MSDEKQEKELTIKRDKPTGTMQHMRNESLMLFDECHYNNKTFKLFYGVGKVYRVVKGDKCDLLYINFGMFPEHPRRLVVVIENHSRRQLLTVKRGQVCQVYGMCRYFSKIVKNRVGNTKRKVALGLFAYGINGWYVPTMVDIKKLPKSDAFYEATEKEIEYQDTLTDVLDQFLNKEIEEDLDEDERVKQFRKN